MDLLKQVSGIDVSQKELVVTLAELKADLTKEFKGYKVFYNTEKGMNLLLKWVDQNTQGNLPVHYVMEATGVYHERFAYFLESKGKHISIVLPNKISNYMRSLDTKTITDKTSSQAIALFGLDRKLDKWTKPAEVFKRLKQLTRERDQLVAERVMVKNQLHAEQTEALSNASSIKRLNTRIKFLSKQESEIKQDINSLIKDNPKVKEIIDRITTITGIGDLTAIIVLAETNGFELIRNKKQLVSYAGLDVREKESGTSVKAKPRISKKGNRSIRKAMHLPSLSAVKHDNHFKEIYGRLVSKHGIKKKALVAIQRKLLELIYIIYKNETVYQMDFETKKREQPLNVASL